jgi:hypothetical protein
MSGPVVAVGFIINLSGIVPLTLYANVYGTNARGTTRFCLQRLTYSGNGGHPGNCASAVFPMYFKSSMPIFEV